ncbi:hypothetical protein [Pseudotamlana carrageenivorans]|uniref:Tox-REase-7 domain-containing protein n=1 Tax=Pseudotamlana carrageenivorans TaxID=2069432 RepID=A0A2I7SHH1_9FLAO|nr:hypothetical protein [Tamlana carrageenivorans]AUS05349.1 hypothetical protein C1A40_07600 [Tamlana carrageenivorans]
MYINKLFKKLSLLLVCILVFQFGFAHDEYSEGWANQHGIEWHSFDNVQQYDTFAAANGRPTSHQLHDMAVSVGFFEQHHSGNVGDDSIFGSAAAYNTLAAQNGWSPINYQLHYPDGSVVEVNSKSSVFPHESVTINPNGVPVSIDLTERINGGRGIVLINPVNVIEVNGKFQTTEVSDSGIVITFSEGEVAGNGLIRFNSITYINNSDSQETFNGVNFNRTDEGIDIINIPEVNPVSHISAGNTEFIVTGPIESFPQDPYRYYRLEYLFVRDNTRFEGYRLKEVVIDQDIFDTAEIGEIYAKSNEIADLLNLNDGTTINNSRKAILRGDAGFTRTLYDLIKFDLPLSTADINTYILLLDEMLAREVSGNSTHIILDILGESDDDEKRAFLESHPDFRQDIFNQIMRQIPFTDAEKSIYITAIESEMERIEQSECETDTSTSCSSLISDMMSLRNQKPPLMASIQTHIDYKNNFAVLVKQLGGETNALVAEVYFDAAGNAKLNYESHSAIADNIVSTIDQSASADFNIANVTDQEGLRIITEDTIETKVITEVPEVEDIASQGMTYGDYLTIAEPFLIEILIGFLPFSDVIELVRSLSGDEVDKLGLSFAIAGIITSAVGGSAIKGTLKSVKVIRKITKVIDALGTAGKAAAKAASNGFETTLDHAGRLILKKGDYVIASGDGVVKDYLVDLSRTVADAVNNKLSNFLSSGVKTNLDDAIERGDFLPEIVEDSVEEIAVATAKKGSPLSWDEVKALFKRGNDFNKKAATKYRYNEIHLGNGKRLDSYIPGKEIVSRKATDLKNIKASTFENYLKELTTKYKKGITIRSNKYKSGSGAIDGQTLSGDYFLEIPASNKAFYEASTTFKNLANQYGVKIKYLVE